MVGITQSSSGISWSSPELLTAIYNDQYAAEMIAYGQEPVWDEYGAPQIRELLELKEISQQRSDQIEERIAEIEEFAGSALD